MVLVSGCLHFIKFGELVLILIGLYSILPTKKCYSRNHVDLLQLLGVQQRSQSEV
jgi:hypothetical protein